MYCHCQPHEIASYLLVHPQFGRTPLSLAAFYGELPIIELLVQNGAIVRHCDKVSNVNLIHVHVPTVEPLINKHFGDKEFVHITRNV